MRVAICCVTRVPRRLHGHFGVFWALHTMNLHGITSFRVYIRRRGGGKGGPRSDGGRQECTACGRVKEENRSSVYHFWSSLDSNVLKKLGTLEAQMHAADKLVQDTEVWG